MLWRLRCVCFLVLLAFASLASPPAQAETTVRVAGYVFPPFLNNDGTGITPDFIAFLNQAQDIYHFELYSSAPARRFLNFRKDRADMVLFEMDSWGWARSGVGYEMSRPFLGGKEVFITRRGPEKTQAYFDDLAGKRLAIMYGYHYGFADMNADPAWLRRNYMPWFTDIQQDIVNVVLKRDIELGIVNQAFLDQYLDQNPQARDNILIGDTPDQNYTLGAIIRDGGPITAQQFNTLLERLQDVKMLEAFFAEQGLSEEFIFTRD